MKIDVRTINSKIENEILSANSIVIIMNRILTQIQNTADEKQKLEADLQAFIDYQNKLKLTIESLGGDRELLLLDKSILSTQREHTPKKAFKQGKSLKRSIKNIDDIIQLIEEDIRSNTQKLSDIESSTLPAELNKRAKQTSLKIVNLVKLLCCNINKYRELRKNIFETYQIRLSEINLTDCVESLANGKVVTKTTNLPVTQLFYPTETMLGTPYIENGIEYILEEY